MNYRATVLICQIGLLAVILSFWPWATVPFEIPKVVTFQWFTRILAVLMIFDFFKRSSNWKIDSKVLISVSILLIWVIVTSIFGVDSAKSFLGNFYRKDGVVTFFSLVGFSFIINYFWNKEFTIPVFGSLYLSGLLLSFPTLLGVSNASGFGNPVFLAGFLAVSLPFSFYLAKVSRYKILYLGVVIQALAIVFIDATSAILTLILFAIVQMYFYLKTKLRYFYIIILTIFGFLLTYLWGMDYFYKNSQSLVAEGRVRIAINGFQGFVKRPLLGYGFSNFDYAFENGSWPIKLNSDVYIDKAHSEVFEFLVTTGIFGLLFYLYFLANVFKKIIAVDGNDFKITLFSVFVLYLFHAQTNVISIAEQILFWLIVGIVI